jgi:hypothetical protein
MRTGILVLNAAHGTPNSDTRGYHETITRACLVLLARFARDNADLDGAALAQALLSSPLAQRDALFTYYSKDRLMSVQRGGIGSSLICAGWMNLPPKGGSHADTCLWLPPSGGRSAGPARAGPA